MTTFCTHKIVGKIGITNALLWLEPENEDEEEAVTLAREFRVRDIWFFPLCRILLASKEKL